VFSGLMMNTWIAATIVAVIAGVTGFFAVVRGQSFAAHAIPNGAFAGAAGAGLLGLNVIWGLAAFAVAAALGIGALGRRARQDVVTALVRSPAARAGHRRGHRHRPGHRLGRHRALLPHQLAARLLRRRHCRRVLPRRPGLGRCPPAPASGAPRARAQFSPLIPGESMLPDRGRPQPGRAAGGSVPPATRPDD
jgi:hypothetical protein